jgi:hypothetical protein
MGDLLTRLRERIPTLPLNAKQKAVLSAVVDAAELQRVTEAAAKIPVAEADDPAPEPPADDPEPTLSAQAERYLAQVRDYLRQKDVEMFKAIGVNRAGAIVMDLAFTDGDPNTATVDPAVVVQEAIKTKAKAVYALHNHPGADGRMSEADKGLTWRLRTALKTAGVSLLGHEVVPSVAPARPPARVTEADMYRLAWEERDAEERRLWAPYGGVRPPWAGGR